MSNLIQLFSLLHSLRLSFIDSRQEKKQKHNLRFLVILEKARNSLIFIDLFSWTKEMLSIFRGFSAKIAPSASILDRFCSNHQSQFHTNAALFDKGKRFVAHNDKIYPPQTENETPRPAVSGL